MSSEPEQIRAVERILDAGAAHLETDTPRAEVPSDGHPERDVRARATLALCLCACYDDDLSPTWLIYGDEDDLVWCSVPDGMDVDDIVRAETVAGSHTSSLEVLEWLADQTSLPGDDQGAHSVAHRIRERLTSAPS